MHSVVFEMDGTFVRSIKSLEQRYHSLYRPKRVTKAGDHRPSERREDKLRRFQPLATPNPESGVNSKCAGQTHIRT
jgi:hypothetical protein